MRLQERNGKEGSLESAEAHAAHAAHEAHAAHAAHEHTEGGPRCNCAALRAASARHEAACFALRLLFERWLRLPEATGAPMGLLRTPLETLDVSGP